MLKSLISFFKKFRSTKDTNTNNHNEQSKACFSVGTDDKIDVLLTIPETSQMSGDDIANYAEKYAQLLILINYGALKTDLLQTLHNQAVNNKISINDQLFFNNTLSMYHSLLATIDSAHKKIDDNEPLIKPSSVFRINS